MHRRLVVVILALAFGSSPSQAQHSRMRLAWIGLELDGSWGFMNQAQAEPEAELVAVADPHPDLIERAKTTTKPGVRFFDDYVRMLDEVKPDAVLSTTPNNQHLEIVRACARRRIHVWFQKPMATNLKDAREMERLAREAGIVLMINYWNLWEPAMQALTARVQAGDIGPVERFVSRNAFPASKNAATKRMSPYYFNYFHDAVKHGGGAIMDQGTYGIDYALWLMGRPTRVFAVGKNLRALDGLRTEDEGWVMLDYPKATAVIWGGWWVLPETAPGVGENLITGPKGILSRAMGAVTFTPGADPGNGIKTGPPQTVPAPEIPPERRHGVAHFVDCIRHNKSPDTPHTAALNVMVHEVVEAAYESIRTGRAITLPAKN